MGEMDREVQVQRQGWQSRVGVAMEWSKVANAAVLVLPFFLWGTNMVVMEEVMPKTGALFAAAVRLIPAGALMVLQRDTTVLRSYQIDVCIFGSTDSHAIL